MDLGTLKPTKGSISSSKRIGRGNGSGQGRTAGKGHKGYQSRSGTKNRFHFEGGQTPLMRRLPKRGFSNYGFRKDVQIVNLGIIASLEIEKVDVNILYEKGMIKKTDITDKHITAVKEHVLTKHIDLSSAICDKQRTVFNAYMKELDYL